jgi:hypothetical protein
MNNIFETLDLLMNRYGFDDRVVSTSGLPGWVIPVSIVVAVVLGIVYCFFGYKAMRFIAALVGFAAGVLVGDGIARAAEFKYPLDLVMVIAGGVLLAVLGFFLFRVFMFIAVFLSVFSITMSLIVEYTKLDSMVILIVALVVGVIFAILAAVYLRTMIIVATALSGGFILSNELFENLIRIQWSPSVEAIVRLSVGLLLAVIGMIYQFHTTPKEEDEDDYEE